MTDTIAIALPGNETMAASIASRIGADLGQLETRHFPDGESYLRFKTDLSGKTVVLVCSLDRPDPKALALIFAADAARQLGARRVALVAPYLCYMRQDKRFQAGEAITSRSFAKLISGACDFLVTVDPHLHRYHALGELYTISSVAVPAAPLLADWIGKNVSNAVLIGPDIESEQWVAQVARRIGAPFRVLQKTRHGDRAVDITTLDLQPFQQHTPVLIDDIVSSGRTMLETVRRLREQSLPSPVCLAVHALLEPPAYQAIRQAASKFVSTNTVAHPSNGIDVSGVLSEAIAPWIA